LLIIITLAYNEEQNIGLLMENILAMGYGRDAYQVIVVDDGSRDATVNIVGAFADKMPITIIRHSNNQGVGAAFRTGFDVALHLADPDDVIVTMEADNTSDLAILPEMVHRVASGTSELVLASCYTRGGGIEGTNLWRKFLSWSANLLLVLAFPIRNVKTYSSFYRAYRASVLRRAIDAYDGKLIEEPGFVCMVEVLVKMHWLGIRISEVPMVLKIELRKGSSKMRILNTIRGYIRFISKHLFGRPPWRFLLSLM
jgi:dolichol-phosphate mannosyltransferase